MTSASAKLVSAKVWSCGCEQCPYDRYWPRYHHYTEDYEHAVWGSDMKFRNGEDTCGRPQFLFRYELGEGMEISPKNCQKPVLSVKSGTELMWRLSHVGMKVHVFRIAFDNGSGRALRSL